MSSIKFQVSGEKYASEKCASMQVTRAELDSEKDANLQTDRPANFMVSVVVPTYRRPQLLLRCLQALGEQTLDAGAYEVIVVDNAGCSQTRRAVEAFAGRLEETGPTVRYLQETSRPGPAAARNRGWRAARGEVIAFTDDDCVPQRQWLAAGLAAFSDGELGVMGQTVVPVSPDPTDYERNLARLSEGHFITANCFYRRKALEAAGGFDERFTEAWREDSDLFFAIEKAHSGEQLFSYAPQAVVCHPPRDARWGSSIWEQRKSMFNALLYKKYPERYWASIQPAPPWRYYRAVLALLGGLLALLSGRRSLGALLLGVWALITGRFAAERLSETSHAPEHVAEMLVTSVVIPPLSIFWRLLGAVRFRVFFL